MIGSHQPTSRHVFASLKNRPDATVCQSSIEVIDADGNHIKYRDMAAGAESHRASDRFDAQLNKKFGSCIEIFGVIRSDILNFIGPMKDHKAADRTMLLELAICGRILTVHDRLFYHRDHAGRFTRSHYDLKEELAWYAPNRGKSDVPLGIWTLYAESIRIIRQRAPNRNERWRCYNHLARSLTTDRRWKKTLTPSDHWCLSATLSSLFNASMARSSAHPIVKLPNVTLI